MGSIVSCNQPWGVCQASSQSFSFDKGVEKADTINEERPEKQDLM